MIRDRVKTPRWVWPIILVLASAEPLTHLWIAYGLPAGSVPTGLHIPDTICFRVFMDMFESDFHSPHATCKAPQGTNFFGYFAVPYYWLYGVLGAFGNLLSLDDFLLLGFANGVAAALYLWAVYRFLVNASPQHANLAFVFFTLGGGLGGALYVITGVLGLHSAPAFEANFTRYALYELLEGPCLSPILHFPRLYYGVAFVFCYGSLAALIKASRRGSRKHLGVAALFILMASFLNTRFGPFAWVIGAFYLYTQEDISPRTRVRTAAVWTLSTIAGAGMGLLMLRLNPSIVGTTVTTVRQAMWLFPFLSAAFFYLFLVPCEVRVSMRRLPAFGRACCCAAVGYLAAFTLLYVAHQAYWGNYFKGGEPDAALFSSDKALAGAALGFVFGLVRKVRDRKPDAGVGWVVLWLLSFLCIGLSTWGNGWFLGFSPQRSMAMLGVPLALLAARRVAILRVHRPTAMRVAVATIVGCGATSIAVSALCFQGPLFHKPGEGPFAWHHVESMTPHDAEVLEHLEPGIVLSTKPLSDVIALRPGNQVIFGAATGHADQLYETVKEGVDWFFSPDASAELRAEFLDEWCVDYVFCPDTFPVATETVEQLYQMEQLEAVWNAGDAVLFATRDSESE